MNTSGEKKRNMKLLRQYGLWWVLLLVFTALVSVLTSKDPTFGNVMISMGGHLGFSLTASLVLTVIYWLVRKQMTFRIYMYLFTAAWLMLAVANVSVM